MGMQEKYLGLILNKAVRQHWRIQEFSYINDKRPDCGFLYVQSGRIIFHFKGSDIICSAGDIVYLPKGTNYIAEFCLDNQQVSDLLINFEYLTDNEFFSFKEPTRIAEDKNFILKPYFRSVVKSYEHKEHLLLTQSLFFRLLYELSDFIKDKKYPDHINEATKLLCEHPELSIESVCKAVGKSRSVLQKEFNFYLGTSPIQYKNKKRIESAIHLLTSTELPVKEISERLCFYDTAYFYKIFERFTGKTPSKVREESFSGL